jgi:hypothetical protein
LALFDTVLSGQTVFLGETHTRRLTTARHRAMLLTDMERYAAAEEVLLRTLEYLPVAEEYPLILQTRVLDTLARVWTTTGRPDQAARAR